MFQRQSTTAYCPRQVFAPGEWNRDPFDRTPTRIKNRLRHAQITGKTRDFLDYVHGWYYGQDRGDINRMGLPCSLTQMARVLGTSRRTAERVLKEVRNKELLVVEVIDGRTTFAGADPRAPTTRLIVLPGGLDPVESSPHLNARSGTATPPPEFGDDRPRLRIVAPAASEGDQDPSSQGQPFQPVDKWTDPSPHRRRGFYVRRGTGPAFVERDLPTAVLDILDTDRRHGGVWWALVSADADRLDERLVAWMHDEVQRLWSGSWAMEHLRWAIAHGRLHEERLRQNAAALDERRLLVDRERRLRLAEQLAERVRAELPEGVTLPGQVALDRVLDRCRDKEAVRQVKRGQLPCDEALLVDIVDAEGATVAASSGGGKTSLLDVLVRDLRDELAAWHVEDLAREAREAAERAAADAAEVAAEIVHLVTVEDEALLDAERASRSTTATDDVLAEATRTVLALRHGLAHTRSAVVERRAAVARLRAILGSVRVARVEPPPAPPEPSRRVPPAVAEGPARGSPEWHAQIRERQEWARAFSERLRLGL